MPNMPTISPGTINSFNITSTTVDVPYSSSGTVSIEPTASPYYNGDTVYVFDSCDLYINGSHKKNSSSTSGIFSDIAHGASGNSDETQSFTVQVKLTYIPSECSATIETRYRVIVNGSVVSSGFLSESAAKVWANNQNYESYYVQKYSVTTGYVWTRSAATTISSTTVTKYAKPDVWTFSYNNTSLTWVVDKGIQTLITNITSFPSAAKRFLKWKQQTGSPTNVPDSLFDSNNELSASKINTAYSYLGGNASYSAGDDVSKAIFTGLENLLK